MMSERRWRSSAFLLGAGTTGLLAFGLPLFLSPLRWARALRWCVPADTDLTVYLGRSLGAVAVALSTGALRAARRPEEQRMMVEVGFLTGALLTAVHVWGALLRRQPWTETAEIGFWSAMTAAALLAYPRQGLGGSSQDNA
jgi:hypothetical protein